MRFKTNRANNGLYVGMSTTATQYGDTVHAGTPRDGIAGGCYKGDGSGYVNIGYHTAFEQQNFRLTFDFIARGAANRDGLINLNGNFRDNNNGSGIIIRYRDNTLQFIIISSLTSQTVVVFTITVNTHYKVIITRFSGTSTIQVNDTIQTTNAGLFFSGDATMANTTIGSNWFDGSVFTQNADSEIWGVIYEELNSAGSFVRYLGFWKCDETNGATAYDSSGNGRHGTITNAVTAPGPTSIHQTQDIFSWSNVVGYSIRKFYSSIPSQFQQVATAFTGGDLSYSQFDFTTVGARGTVGGVYTDEIGQFVYNVEALRLEAIPTSLIFPTDASINFRLFLTNPTSVRLEENYQDTNSLRTVVFAYVADKGIADTAPNTIDAYYQTASQADQDELDAIFSVRDVADWTTYFNPLPSNLKSSTSSISAAWIPSWIQPLQTGTTELQTIIVPEQPLSTSTINSNIRILGGLRARVDNSIISDRLRESRLYEYFVLENDETTLVPRDESQQLSPFRDVLGNNLQFVGHAQYNADWVDSGAFQGNDSAHIDCGLITNGDLQNLRFSMSFERQAATQTDMLIHWNGRTPSAGLIIYINSGGSLSISIYTGTETPMFSNIPVNGVGEVNNLVLDYTENGLTLNINGNIHTASYQAIQYATTNRKTLIGAIQSTNITTPTNNKIWNVKVDELNVSGDFVQMLADWPLVEPIENAANHTYYNRLGSNHATLTNGSVANYGRQNVFHPLVSEGFSNRIPIIPRNQSTTSYNTTQTADITTTVNTRDRVVFSFDRRSSGSVIYEMAIDDGAGQITRQSGKQYRLRARARYTNVSFAAFTILLRTNHTGLNIGDAAYVGPTDQGGNFFDIDHTYTDNGVSLSSQIAIAFQLNIPLGTSTPIEIEFEDFSLEEVDVFIPKHATNNTDALGNPLTHPQDGETFLDCGTGFVMPRVPELVQADAQLVFYSTDSAPQNRSWDFIRLNQFNNNKVFVGNVNSDDGELSPIVFHENPLVRAQLDTEKRVRNAVDVGDIPLSVTLTAVRNSVSVVMYTITGTLLIAATEEIRFRTTITNANGAGNPSMVTTTINNGDTSGTNSVLTTISGTPATTGASFDVTVSAILVSPTIGYAITVETMTVTVPAFIDTSVFVTVGAMRMSNGNVRITYDGALDYAPREQVNVTITASNANGSGSINTTGVTFQADDTTAMNTIDIVNAITGAYTITFAVASVTTGFTAQLSTTSINIPVLSLSPVTITPDAVRLTSTSVRYSFVATVASSLSTSDIVTSLSISNANGSGSIINTSVTIPQNMMSGNMTRDVTDAITNGYGATLMVTSTTPATHQGELTETLVLVPAFDRPIRIETSVQRTATTSAVYTVRGVLAQAAAEAVTATIQIQNSNGIGGEDNIELSFSSTDTEQTETRTVSLAGSLIGLNNQSFTATVRQHPNFPPTMGFSLDIVNTTIVVPSF